MVRPLKVPWQFRVSSLPGRSREMCSAHAEHFPEQCFHQVAVMVLVRVGEAIAAREHRSSSGQQPSRVSAQSIEDVVEPDGLGQMAIEQTIDMVPRAEGPAPGINLVSGCQLAHHPERNELADWMKGGEIGSLGFGDFF